MIFRGRNLTCSDASCVYAPALYSSRWLSEFAACDVWSPAEDARAGRCQHSTIDASFRCVKMIANDQFQASSHSAGAVVIFMKLK